MSTRLVIFGLLVFSSTACGTYTTGGTRYSFDFTRMITNLFVDEVTDQVAEAEAERVKQSQNKQR